MKYIVTEGKKRDGIQDFSVRTADQREFEAAGVWVSDSGSSVRCCECSGPLAAMSASCRHVKAVKRYLAKKARGGLK